MTGGAGARDDPSRLISPPRYRGGNSQVLMRRSNTFTTGCWSGRANKSFAAKNVTIRSVTLFPTNPPKWIVEMVDARRRRRATGEEPQVKSASRITSGKP